MTNFIQKILKPTENFYMKFKKKMLFFVRTIHRFFLKKTIKLLFDLKICFYFFLEML